MDGISIFDEFIALEPKLMRSVPKNKQAVSYSLRDLDIPRVSFQGIDPSVVLDNHAWQHPSLRFRPPFDFMWIEREFGRQTARSSLRIGAFVVVDTVEKTYSPDMPEVQRGMIQMVLELVKRADIFTLNGTPGEWKPAHYMVSVVGSVLARVGATSKFIGLGAAMLGITKDGALARDEKDFSILTAVEIHDHAFKDDDMSAHISEAMFDLGLMLSLFNVKNITLVDKPHVPRHIQRQVQRATGQPPVEFKELAVTPLRQKTQARPTGESAGGVRPLHLCRGHFAHYSDERPLFGKYPGTFWVPAHMRGTAAAGEVKKTYLVRK